MQEVKRSLKNLIKVDGKNMDPELMKHVTGSSIELSDLLWSVKLDVELNPKTLELLLVNAKLELCRDTSTSLGRLGLSRVLEPWHMKL